MSFILETEPTFWTKVEVTTPTDDGARKDTFRARFVLQPASVVEQLERQEITAAEFLKKALIDLDDILDANKKAISFDANLKATMLNHATARIAILRAYYGAISQARAGN